MRKRKKPINERISVRLDEKGLRQLEELVDLFESETTISRITVTDIVLMGIDTLHEVKFPDREDDEDENEEGDWD
ncbi:hypothetical protein [Priestia endophytica]|uniref:hypothetical protein n=1 Tax=Priestia endophytica TaxID=135735 RepID=UPI0022804DD9|nr:hypothetical protein [Priestia endophytica]MCY8235390.1 hypothetical protein [Priestia endophytica]